MRFVIDRSKLRCGGAKYRASGLKNSSIRGLGHTYLLNPQGYMCCLGHIACQMGIDKAILLEKAEPYGVSNHCNMYDNIFLNDNLENNDLSLDAMNINDDDSIDDATRENNLTELFAKYGHSITFINEYVKHE